MTLYFASSVDSDCCQIWRYDNTVPSVRNPGPFPLSISIYKISFLSLSFYQLSTPQAPQQQRSFAPVHSTTRHAVTKTNQYWIWDSSALDWRKQEEKKVKEAARQRRRPNPPVYTFSNKKSKAYFIDQSLSSPLRRTNRLGISTIRSRGKTPRSLR